MSRQQFLDTIADLQCAIYYSGEEFLIDKKKGASSDVPFFVNTAYFRFIRAGIVIIPFLP